MGLPASGLILLLCSDLLEREIDLFEPGDANSPGIQFLLDIPFEIVGDGNRNRFALLEPALGLEYPHIADGLKSVERLRFATNLSPL